MPSRTGMILSMQRRQAAGDPFFGAIARLAARGVGAIIRRVARPSAAPTGVIRGATGIARRGVAALSGTRTGRILRAGAGAVGVGAAFEVGSRAIRGAVDPETGMPFRKRRGINPLNPRAARRAVSRLCRLQHFTDRLEHSLAGLVKPRHGHHRVHHRHKR